MKIQEKKGNDEQIQNINKDKLTTNINESTINATENLQASANGLGKQSIDTIDSTQKTKNQNYEELDTQDKSDLQPNGLVKGKAKTKTKLPDCAPSVEYLKGKMRGEDGKFRMLPSEDIELWIKSVYNSGEIDENKWELIKLLNKMHIFSLADEYEKENKLKEEQEKNWLAPKVENDMTNSLSDLNNYNNSNNSEQTTKLSNEINNQNNFEIKNINANSPNDNRGNDKINQAQTNKNEYYKINSQINEDNLVQGEKDHIENESLKNIVYKSTNVVKDYQPYDTEYTSKTTPAKALEKQPLEFKAAQIKNIAVISYEAGAEYIAGHTAFLITLTDGRMFEIGYGPNPRGNYNTVSRFGAVVTGDTPGLICIIPRNQDYFANPKTTMTVHTLTNNKTELKEKLYNFLETVRTNSENYGTAVQIGKQDIQNADNKTSTQALEASKNYEIWQRNCATFVYDGLVSMGFKYDWFFKGSPYLTRTGIDKDPNNWSGRVYKYEDKYKYKYPYIPRMDNNFYA